VRVLAYVHMYPPKHNAGAEMMVHAIMRYLVARGHEAVAVTKSDDAWDIDGVSVLPHRRAHAAVRDADVVLTHLDLTRDAIAACERYRKPLVHLVHNHRQLRYHRVQTRNAQLLVFNSEWLTAATPHKAPSMVLYPPVFVEDYETPGEGDAVLLANLNLQKGAMTFYAAAEQVPELRFLGIRGAYGPQIDPLRKLDNVEIRDNTPDMRAVYAETGVVLMPSHYESWGRVAIEAACSGIPTIAHPTEGLRESLGEGGLFADRKKTRAWVAAIRRLQEPEARAAAREYHRNRARELDAACRAQLDDLHDRLISL
jgi:glycosyltransferase involved in cell wall biosynthesis